MTDQRLLELVIGITLIVIGLVAGWRLRKPNALGECASPPLGGYPKGYG